MNSAHNLCFFLLWKASIFKTQGTKWQVNCKTWHHIYISLNLPRWQEPETWYLSIACKVPPSWYCQEINNNNNSNNFNNNNKKAALQPWYTEYPLCITSPDTQKPHKIEQLWRNLTLKSINPPDERLQTESKVVDKNLAFYIGGYVGSALLALRKEIFPSCGELSTDRRLFLLPIKASSCKSAISEGFSFTKVRTGR